MEKSPSKTPSFSNLNLPLTLQQSEVDTTPATELEFTPRHPRTNTTNLVRYQLFQLGIESENDVVYP